MPEKLKAVPEPPNQGLVPLMAERFSMMPEEFKRTIKSTCFGKEDVPDTQLLAFLVVAKEYQLNPFTREIYAFARPGGGVQPIVSVDGWAKLVNSHPQFDGMSFEDKHEPSGKLVSITCRIYRKDRTHPTEATEYMTECMRNTEPWKQWPKRMLRHKALAQAARYAFSFAGIVEPDEAERAFDKETTATAVLEHEDERLPGETGRQVRESKVKAPEEPETVHAEPVDDSPIGADGADEIAERLNIKASVFTETARQMGFPDFATIPKSRQAEFEAKLKGA